MIAAAPLTLAHDGRDASVLVPMPGGEVYDPEGRIELRILDVADIGDIRAMLAELDNWLSSVDDLAQIVALRDQNNAVVIDLAAWREARG